MTGSVRRKIIISTVLILALVGCAGGQPATWQSEINECLDMGIAPSHCFATAGFAISQGCELAAYPEMVAIPIINQTVSVVDVVIAMQAKGFCSQSELPSLVSSEAERSSGNAEGQGSNP